MCGKADSDPCSAHPQGLVSRDAFPSWRLSHHSHGGCRQRWEDTWLEKHINEPMLFPPGVTWLLEDLVTCLGVIPPAFFHAVSEFPLSPLPWKLCLLAFVLRPSGTCPGGLGAQWALVLCPSLGCTSTCGPLLTLHEENDDVKPCTLVFLRASIKTEASPRCGLP